MLSALLLAVLSGPALAQDDIVENPNDDGFDGHGYTQIPSDGDVGDAINVWRPEQQVPGSWGIEGLFEYVDRPVVLVRGSGDNETRTALLDNGFGLNLGGHVAFHERVAAAVSMPIWFTTGGTQGEGGPTVGDLRLAVPVGILMREPDDAGFGLSVIPGLRLPTGNTGRLLGDKGAGGEIIVAPGWGNDTWEIAGNIGAGFGPTASFENLSPGNHLITGLSAGWRMEDKFGARIEAWLHPALNSSEVSGKGTPGEVALSGRAKIVDALTASLSLQTAITPGAGASAFRILAGVGTRIGKGPQDSDRDGITDDMDACPDEPEVVNSYMDDDGCPDALANLIVTVADPNGEPMPGAEVSVNGDVVGMTGVDGRLMLSDQMPGDVTVTVTDPSGRTESDMGDNTMTLEEGDAEMPFSQIWVPGTLQIVAQDGDGNPVDAAITWNDGDNNGEGSLGDDGMEILVLGPGTWDVFASAPGFKPERRSVELAPNDHSLEIIELSLEEATTVVTETSIVILEAINFEVNSADISPESITIVDEVANNLLLAPEIGKVEVQGHTDSQGSSSYNRDLSQRRVDSVTAAMVQRGVAASRLTAVGFGEDCAIASNGTVDGRAKNRRVQFFIVDPAPEDGVPCHDGRPGQDTVESIQLEREVEQ